MVSNGQGANSYGGEMPHLLVAARSGAGGWKSAQCTGEIAACHRIGPARQSSAAL